MTSNLQPALRKQETLKLLGQVTAAARHGQTHMLVQPGPLLGAMNVRDGALVESDPKYRPADIEQESEDPEVVRNQTVPEYSIDEDKVLMPLSLSAMKSFVAILRFWPATLRARERSSTRHSV